MCCPDDVRNAITLREERLNREAEVLLKDGTGKKGTGPFRLVRFTKWYNLTNTHGFGSTQ
jgi:hypothetical protein